MASAIDATVPVTGSPTTESVRANFATAKAEISALQAGGGGGGGFSPGGTASQLLSGTGSNVNVGTGLTLSSGTLSGPTTVLPSSLTLRSPLQATDNIVVYDASDNDLRATPAQFVAYMLATGGSFTKPVAVTPVLLTWAATVTIDATASNNFRVVLGGATTFANPTGMIDGQEINLRLKQDGTGTRTATWGSKWKWPGGTAPTLSTAINAVDRVSGTYVQADDVIEATCVKAYA